MQFTQTGPTRSEADDGSVVDLVDSHHAKLVGPTGTWLVELKPAEDDDWFAIELYAGSIVRAGAAADQRYSQAALESFVEGLRALRVRVRLDDIDPGDGVEIRPPDPV